VRLLRYFTRSKNLSSLLSYVCWKPAACIMLLVMTKWRKLYTQTLKSFVLIFVVFIDSPKLKSITKPKQALQAIRDIKWMCASWR